ncbi:unnamed protein product, partial [Effrenium voratum]
ACVEKAQRDTFRVSHYFGSRGAPRWFLGMGWVFGRRIVDFLARNVGDLKKNGAADVQLGFWLAPLEGIEWVDMKDGQFHDYPMPGSTFSNGCTERSILVHRMNEERWKDFDPGTCELRCPLRAEKILPSVPRSSARRSRDHSPWPAGKPVLEGHEVETLHTRHAQIPLGSLDASPAQVGGHLDEQRRRGKVKSLAQQRGQELREAIAQREAGLKGCRRQRFLLGFLKKRHAAAYALRDFCTRLDEYCAKESKEAVLASARVFLCTIASSSRMLREWEEAMGSELRVHTVIVDECGCTPESSTALLLRIRPSNLVLVGDHKQLPPTSLVQPQLLEGTGHNRSLLERCVLASGRVHQLREQYRMHPSIASVVSGLFYAGRLLTPLSVAQERKAQEPRPLVWMDVQGRDEAPNKSYVNFSEVSACVRVVARIRERVGPGPSVALLTFYKGQLEELMKALPSNLDAEVLTVDACQGSEFDFVILSTVRANREQRLGFVKDAQRICVATSRSRMQLFIVGHRQTLASDGDWRKVAEACLPPKPDEVQPQRPLPASFVSVFDALRKAKEKEAEQKALQAMEEQDAKGRGKSRSPGVSYYGAESLMRQQGSFRGAKTLTRRKDGSYASGSVVAIGGGFRSRRDVQELENLAKAHLQSMEAPRPEQSARNSASAPCWSF